MRKLLILIMCLFLTGCWNYWELNDIAIITGIAIDKMDDNYLVSIMIANSKKPESNSKEGESLPSVYDGVGKTIALAIENASLKSSKKIYFNHLNSLIISEKVAKEGTLNVMDVLFRDPMSRKNFYVLIASKSASDVLKIVSPLEAFPSQDINTTLNNASDMQMMSISISYDEFISDLITNGIDPILPTINIFGDSEEGKSQKSLEEMKPAAIVGLESMALFKDDRLIAIATPDEAKGINLLKRGYGRIFLELDCDDSYLIIDTKEFKVKMDYDTNVNIRVKAIGTIKEVNCKMDLEDPKVIKELEKESASNLQSIIEKSIKKTQELGIDTFGFGNLIYKETKKSKIELHQIKPKIEVIIDIKAKGGIEQSIKEVTNE